MKGKHMKTTKSQKELKSQRLENAHITEDGLSYQEIAKILGLTVGEVKKIEHEALLKLRKPSTLNKDLHRYWNITLRPLITEGFEVDE
jgi:DNA-directed RNA polymerase sigma subunit (sigma70/sigma32)